MKKLFVLVVVFLLAACGGIGGSSNLETFDNSKLKEELKEGAFQPRLPTNTPFKVTDTQVIHPPNQDTRLMIDFMSYGDNEKIKNTMGLVAVNGKNVESSMLEFEEVEIGEITGQYAVNGAEAMILKWSEDGISYSLTYYGKQSEKEVKKEELIDTAESFE
ncbi:DUF4367 domain-containing protein [Bacillus sp. SG-1]|uniref:DUF4367 domain-containing protein n=1 Tax=Bacillus sp. SG-1 TaxID=161544 RepID=UPI0001543F4B|nr:DUF4367 domain-containing protein [Bacillus sp. SG-1]EDL66608.1 hypothetical protein BSG1_04610 [Bacillus sp. SG-1]